MRPIFRFDDPVPGFVGAISYAFRRGRRVLVPSVALPPEWQPDTTPAS
jgi:hypothetical protein